MGKNIILNLISIIFFCAASAGCYPSVFTTEKSKNGDFSIVSKDKNVVVNFLRNFPKEGETLLGVSVDDLPTVSYHGLRSDSKVPKYSEFFSDKHGFIYDKNFDGFPDEALTKMGEVVKLEIWTVDKFGNRKLLK